MIGSIEGVEGAAFEIPRLSPRNDMGVMMGERRWGGGLAEAAFF